MANDSMNSFDEDIKIAPQHVSSLLKKENPVADDNIDLYLRERALGNTARAKELGRLLVKDLLDCVWTKAPDCVDAALFDTQLKILFVYVVHRTIENCSDNHVLANTAIGSFYEALEAEEPAFFEAMTASTAFTMYLYTHRTNRESAEAIGRVFASVCDAKDCEDCAVIGESAYARFKGICVQRMAEAGYRTEEALG